jgi:DNA recombination protein RmuC
MASSLLIAFLAFAVGGVLAWLAAVSRERATAGEGIRQLEAARAAAESAAGELRKQIAALQAEMAAIRSQLQEEQSARTAAQTALEKTQENLNEQKKLIEEAKTRLTDAFQALASQALDESNRKFLDLAGSKFETLQEKASGDLAQRQTAIAGLVDPLKIALNKFQEQISQVESSRQKAYGELTAQVQQLTESSQLLRQETGSLVTSLRQPQIKGKWGELLLRRAVELAGMVPHCDFTEQPSVDTEEGRLRPDMIVHLPGERQIVVDAKVPLHAFLKALGCRNQDEYHAAMTEHAQLVRTHVAQLSSKKYWQQFASSPEFVVLFLPAESYFSAALEKDHELIEDAMDKGVVLASPTTLLALLKAVAYGWNQQKTAEDAQQIAELGKDLHERVVTFLNHLNEIGANLERANKAFNKAVASAESRLVPGARKFKTLAAPSAEELPAIEPIETAPRQLVVPAPEDE